MKLQKLYFVLGASDPFASTSSFLTSTTAKFVAIGAVVMTLVLVVTGLVYSFAGQELKKKIKDKWVQIVISAIAVFGGAGIIGFLVQFVQQNFN
ncbi:hypothetical protein IGK74_002314 [Enterococcus sp. AZ150]|uniref:hypothetical protein n=1 Tax=Enterococcus sp. AZ150 TaxID=2774866 RepID=UPI003F278CF5